ncbi:MAG: RNA 3'-terminal phosphate cyclase [Planctomycetaceae bacterium]|nr:RNA 3'-terminal phosphate cyclase [Planctomycetaceae bacterium]
MISFDGSQGEGGGQILRTVVGLAAATGQPVRIEKIRANRSKPGLMRQHLTAMTAAAQVCGAMMTGAELRSTELTFEPQEIQHGCFDFNIGTAGSATLVLQTILPALLRADGPSEIVLQGGTHNQWAPPFDFLESVYLPLLNRMGPQVSVRLERHGFYPAGGGRIVASIQPNPVLQGFDLMDRGAIQSRHGTVLITNLPAGIARREADLLVRRLSLDPRDVRLEQLQTPGPGNVVLVRIESEHVTELFTGFGRVGASAETVAREVVRFVRRYLAAEVPVGEFLADQLLLPLSLSAAQPADDGLVRGGRFRTQPPSRHAMTHIDILQKLLPVSIHTETIDGTCSISVAPRE